MIEPDSHFLAPGEVALVGAGPGDPDLLTIAALKALLCADAVVYDALVSPQILDQLRPEQTLHFVGKRGGHPSTSQADICALLVKLAKERQRVVRLKGGDPFVFGRGGEEALALAKAGARFRIIPGVTAGVAGPAYAGIPITHREVNANVAFITGHEAPENAPGGAPTASRVDWAAAGRAFPVLVLYMAMRNLSHVTRRLIDGGRDPETPVAVIRWATTPLQTTLITTLKKAAQDVKDHGLKPPAIIVVGDVVKYREQLAWFEEQDLPPKITESS